MLMYEAFVKIKCFLTQKEGLSLLSVSYTKMNSKLMS